MKHSQAAVVVADLAPVAAAAAPACTTERGELTELGKYEIYTDT